MKRQIVRIDKILDVCAKTVVDGPEPDERQGSSALGLVWHHSIPSGPVPSSPVPSSLESRHHIGGIHRIFGVITKTEYTLALFLSFCALLANGSFLIPNNGELAVIRSMALSQ